MHPIRLALVALGAASLGPAAGAQPAPATVTVVLSSYRYYPNPLVLQADRPVRLLFENRSGKGHDFVAREFFGASQILAGAAPAGRVNLKGGQRAVVELVPRRGVYRVHCSKFMHSGLGMKTNVIVQ